MKDLELDDVLVLIFVIFLLSAQMFYGALINSDRVDRVIESNERIKEHHYPFTFTKE